MHKEVILNVFPGTSDQNRLVLVQTTTICGLEHLLLRQETHAPDVGWFVQNQVAIEPEQVAALKMTLSGSIAQRKTNIAAGNASGSATAVRATNRKRLAGASPVILQFEAAG